MALEIAAKGHVKFFLLLIKIKLLYIQFHSNRINGSGDTLC